MVVRWFWFSNKLWASFVSFVEIRLNEIWLIVVRRKELSNDLFEQSIRFDERLQRQLSSQKDFA
jgi:hypothetical protein